MKNEAVANNLKNFDPDLIVRMTEKFHHDFPMLCLKQI